jgi:hypothetical protein
MLSQRPPSAALTGPLDSAAERSCQLQSLRCGRASVRAVLDDYAAQYNRHRQHTRPWNLRLPGGGEITPAAIPDLRWWTYDAAGCCAD